MAPAVLADELYPPCGEAPEPDYAAVGAPPNLWVITQEGFVWDASRCPGWGKGQCALLVAAAATFKHKEGVEGLVGKFAARVGDQGGALLVDFASGLEALVSVQPMRCRRRGRARGDLAPGDLVPGPVKHFWLEEQGPVDCRYPQPAGSQSAGAPEDLGRRLPLPVHV